MTLTAQQISRIAEWRGWDSLGHRGADSFLYHTRGKVRILEQDVMIRDDGVTVYGEKAIKAKLQEMDDEWEYQSRWSQRKKQHVFLLYSLHDDAGEVLCQAEHEDEATALALAVLQMLDATGDTSTSATAKSSSTEGR